MRDGKRVWGMLAWMTRIERYLIFDEQERIYVILQDQVSEAKLFFEKMPSAKELLTLQIPLSFDRSGEIQPCVPAFTKKVNIWLPLSKWLS